MNNKALAFVSFPGFAYKDEAVDTVMEKQRKKTDKSVVSTPASDSALTMKQKTSTYTCYKAQEDVGSTKECKQQQSDVEQQWQALPF